jgi:hypothetical protein
MIERCIGVTVKNILISGKQGHTSYFARYSYGILFEDCKDIVPVGFNNAGGQGHGPGMRWSTVNTVFLNCKMMEHQSIDCHGYHPYSNLLDNVSGGCFRGNGGAENSYPNSGPYMTFWNFIHASNYNSKEFDFWDPVNRKTHTYGYPIFVGFRSPGENISLKNAGLNELQGKEVYPKSLFDAQLQLRLFGGYMSASSSKEDFMPVFANDGNDQTNWTSLNAGAGEWLMLDLGKAEKLYEITIDEASGTIGEWKLEGYYNGVWETIKTGTNIGANKVISFDPITSQKLRLTIVSMKTGEENNPASVNGFKVTGSSGVVGIFNQFKTNNELITVYPNPSNSIINIDINMDGNNLISVYNSTGKLVWQNRTKQKNIQLSKGTELNEGIYILKVVGNKTGAAKMLIL